MKIVRVVRRRLSRLYSLVSRHDARIVHAHLRVAHGSTPELEEQGVRRVRLVRGAPPERRHRHGYPPAAVIAPVGDDVVPHRVLFPHARSAESIPGRSRTRPSCSPGTPGLVPRFGGTWTAPRARCLAPAKGDGVLASRATQRHSPARPTDTHSAALAHAVSTLRDRSPLVPVRAEAPTRRYFVAVHGTTRGAADDDEAFFTRRLRLPPPFNMFNLFDRSLRDAHARARAFPSVHGLLGVAVDGPEPEHHLPLQRVSEELVRPVAEVEVGHGAAADGLLAPRVLARTNVHDRDVYGPRLVPAPRVLPLAHSVARIDQHVLAGYRPVERVRRVWIDVVEGSSVGHAPQRQLSLVRSRRHV